MPLILCIMASHSVTTPASEASDVVDRLLAALDRLEVAWTRTPAQDVPAAVAAIAEPPIVGVGLPFEGVGLDGVEARPPTADALRTARTGVTAARLAVADYGSIVIESWGDATEAASLFPPLHVAVLCASDVVPNMAAAFDHLSRHIQDGCTHAVLATGPSATADMGALVRGAHGPERVHVVLIDDR